MNWKSQYYRALSMGDHKEYEMYRNIQMEVNLIPKPDQTGTKPETFHTNPMIGLGI